MIALVAYPAGSAIYLSMLDRRMTKFVGLAKFAFLFDAHWFWMAVYQTSLLAIIAVACKAIIGFASDGRRAPRAMAMPQNSACAC